MSETADLATKSDLFEARVLRGFQGSIYNVMKSGFNDML